MNLLKPAIAFLLLLGLSQAAISQEIPLDSLLERSVEKIPALNEKVNISVSNSSIQEFMRAVANSTGLNIDVNPNMDIQIINNFSNVRVLDMLVFLATEYKLEVNVIGNIITVSKEQEPIIPNVTVNYNSSTNTISINSNNEELLIVSKIITEKTGLNVIPQLTARNEKVSVFIVDMPFESAIEKLASANGMTMSKTDDGYFIIDKPSVVANPYNQGEVSSQRNSRSQGTSAQRGGGQSGDYFFDIKKLAYDSIWVRAENAPLEAILKELSSVMNFNYFISPGSPDLITGTAMGKDPDMMLTYLLNGTKTAHKKIDNVYIIGEKRLLDYNERKVIPLQYRSIDKLVESIPKDLTEGLDIIEFIELNSLFVTGPAYQILEFEDFITQIDKAVPVVLIEVIILYINSSINVATGIQAGLGDAPVTTTGSIFPELNINLGANEINRIIRDAGWVRLGQVTPNFYMTLQAMESQGFLDLQSTPQLSTLNGHEATMSIGNTEYYLEERTDIIGTQNPTQTTSQQYKSVNAELKLKIKPVVSGDDQITLEIEVSQSDFTERISETAPPGSVNRDFTSVIRVKNQEMVLLGGLMEKRKSESGTGVPVLSRIPVIKWFFSSRQKESSDSKLSVLIKPTIIK